MSENPLVSVVIPFYNNVEWLEEAVDSVLHQSYKNYEIIVVNDGSNEDVSNFLEKYSSKIKYIVQTNKGPGAARNNGISHAKGDYIALLDSDDVWIENKLQVQVSYMENNKECMWSHSAYVTFGDATPTEMRSSSMSGNLYPECLISCKIATPCVIIRKSVFDNPDLVFSEKMRYGQDFYLWVLLSKLYSVGFINEVLCKVRMRGSNAAKRAFVMLKSKHDLWSNLKGISWMKINEAPFRIKISYSMCSLGFRFISLCKKIIKSEKIVEFFSKVVYLLPYVILKTTKIKKD